MSQDSEPQVLSAPYRLEYRYKRSLGPVMSRYFTGLRDGIVWGNRTPSGKVFSPPVEADPQTGESVALGEDAWVQLSSLGTVVTFFTTFFTTFFSSSSWIFFWRSFALSSTWLTIFC